MKKVCLYELLFPYRLSVDIDEQRRIFNLVIHQNLYKSNFDIVKFLLRE